MTINYRHIYSILCKSRVCVRPLAGCLKYLRPPDRVRGANFELGGARRTMRPPPTPQQLPRHQLRRPIGVRSAPQPPRHGSLLGIPPQNVNPFDRRGAEAAAKKLGASAAPARAATARSRRQCGGYGGDAALGQRRAPLARVPLNVDRPTLAKKHALRPEAQRPSKRLCGAIAMPPPPPTMAAAAPPIVPPGFAAAVAAAAGGALPVRQLGRAHSFVEMHRAEPSRDAWAWGSAAGAGRSGSSGYLAESMARPLSSTELGGGGKVKPTTSRFHTDYTILGTLGGGEFGVVYECLNRLDGCPYAVKRTKAKVRGKLQLQEALKEVYALSAIIAPMAESVTPTAAQAKRAAANAFAPVPLVRTESEIGLRATNELELDRVGVQHIVRYFSAWEEDERVYIQMELCAGCAKEFLLEPGAVSFYFTSR